MLRCASRWKIGRNEESRSTVDTERVKGALASVGWLMIGCGCGWMLGCQRLEYEGVLWDRCDGSCMCILVRRLLPRRRFI
jgi:hypothetical protein